MASDKTERYRQAADDALGQLDWCSRYLREIRHPRIASQLAKNTAHIRRSLREQTREPAHRRRQS